MNYEPQGRGVGFNRHRFQAALAAKGHTQASLARTIGVSLRAVQKWGSSTKPTRPRLEEISRMLDRDPEWFYEYDEPTGLAA